MLDKKDAVIERVGLPGLFKRKVSLSSIERLENSRCDKMTTFLGMFSFLLQ
jgi:hypothetical protein